MQCWVVWTNRWPLVRTTVRGDLGFYLFHRKQQDEYLLVSLDTLQSDHIGEWWKSSHWMWKWYNLHRYVNLYVCIYLSKVLRHFGTDGNDIQCIVFSISSIWFFYVHCTANANRLFFPLSFIFFTFCTHGLCMWLYVCHFSLASI